LIACSDYITVDAKPSGTQKAFFDGSNRAEYSPGLEGMLEYQGVVLLATF
jgi:hypothetical protein